MNPIPKLSGVIFVLIGPGGAGKNAIMKAVLARCSHIQQLATATTRAMRAGEQQGREHLFLTEQQFQQMIARRQLLEYQEVTPNKLYGLPRQVVEEGLRGGKIRIVDIEVLGAKALVKAFPANVVRIFITVPGASIEQQLQVLCQRMQQRNDQTTPISQRLERARRLELPYQSDCDYTVVNDRLEQAAAATLRIIQDELRQRGLPGAAQ